MEQNFKKIRIIFIILFMEYISIGAIFFYLKQVQNLADIIDRSSKITMIVPIILIATILIAYYIYDRIAKKSQNLDFDDTENQLKYFTSAMIIKIGMLNFVGIIVGIMMFLIYQETYLYMLGIIAVFFMLNYPSETKFRRDFVKRNEIFND